MTLDDLNDRTFKCYVELTAAEYNIIYTQNERGGVTVPQSGF